MKGGFVDISVPKMPTRAVQNYIEEEKVNVWSCPPSSPHLNPIKSLCDYGQFGSVVVTSKTSEYRSNA
jgi:hypothetical protein